MLEDYRAGLTIDRANEDADRAAGTRLACPVLVLWSLRDDLEQLHGDPRLIWAESADQVSGHGIDCGHHMAELAPRSVADALIKSFAADQNVLDPAPASGRRPQFRP
jgi:haloacetate dehalogenase